MSAIINFEFLLSPTLSTIDFFKKLVDDLRILYETSMDNSGVIFVEDNIIAKMIDSNSFPSSRIFKTAISKLDDDSPYSAEDIVRMINTIIDRSNVFEEKNLQIVAEWSSLNITPPLHAISEDRSRELINAIENLSLENKYNKKDISILYYHPTNPLFTQQLNINAMISELYPEIESKLPCNFNETFKIHFCLDKYFNSLDGLSIFRSANTALQVKLSLYIGAINAIEKNSFNTKVEWDDFKIGAGLIESLVTNQCFGEQEFSSIFFESAIHIIAKKPKSEVDFFYKSTDPKSPRTSGNLVARRTHLTQKNRGLRLLMWENPQTKEITFSNVGNKFELVILSP